MYEEKEDKTMIDLKNIRKSFGTLQVLKGIDLHVGRGEVVSIVGPSGAGKTTLLQIMGTLDRPDAGSIRIDGTEVERMKERELSAFRNRKIGFVFQFHQLLPEFTAEENIMIPALISGTAVRKAKDRAAELLDFMGLPALADDSGLCVDALGGAPGVRSARYSGGGDAENRALLLKNLSGIQSRAAHFSCAVALVFPDGRETVAEGRTEGEILHEERGAGGFGYDSLFFSFDLKKSFAEATEAEKNSVSHRARALAALEEKL